MTIRSRLKVLARRTGVDVRRVSDGFGIDLNDDLRRCCPSPDVIFDVGANAGQSVARFKGLFSRASIHAFEPDPQTFLRLQAAASSYAGIMLNNTAVGAKPGATNLFLYAHSDMNSVLPSGVANWSEVTASIEVPVVTVDGYCRESGLAHIDLLKTDTQGFDLEVLRGAAEMLAAGCISCVLSEMNFGEIYEGQPSPSEMLRFMQEAGYRVISFYDMHHNAQGLGWLDVLWRKETQV
jgi:FkbM family methyltransferase